MKGLSLEAFGVPSPFDPSFCLVTSPVFSPVALAALRSILAVYTLTTAITTLVYDVVVLHESNSYFSQFTELSWIGLTAYFWASSVQTIAFVLRGQKSYPLQTWPRFLQLFHVILHSTAIVLPTITTIVYWTLLASPVTFETRYNAWSNVSLHMMNSVFALVEILLTNGGPSPWTHLIPIVLILAGYLGVAYLTHATAGFYIYTFLDPAREHGMLAAFIIGIALGSCVMFSIVRGICLLRLHVSMRCARPEVQSDAEALEEWQDMEASKVTPAK